MKAKTENRVRAALACVCAGLTVAISATAADRRVPEDHATIQAAVDAATNGDTIHIAAGVYAGQVLISNKSLTLSGSPGAVLRATAGMSQPYGAMGFTLVPLLGILRSDVVVSNLTFEGEHLANAYTDPQYMLAIFYFGSGGRVEGCRITGFRGPSLGDGFARALQVSNPAFLGTGAVTIQILRNTFADNLISITLIGDSKSFTHSTFNPALLRTTFVVSDNTITGNGPDATGVQNGVHIFAGATGEVSRNTISDHAYVGTTDPTPWAFGILALDDMNFGDAPLQPLKPIRFEGNVLRNNQWHMAMVRGDGSTIVDNTFDGTAPGARPTGLGLSGENLVVARNRFSNLPQGIVLFGNDPDFGTYLGIAHNAQLTTNRFCNVANRITVEPLASANEQGTLACPVSPPALAIAPAVLLSWPAEEDGWSVESAPAVSGPWTPLVATPFLQGGGRNVAVPTDAEHRFFRLRQ
jgi:hypothetical protein